MSRIVIVFGLVIVSAVGVGALVMSSDETGEVPVVPREPPAGEAELAESADSEPRRRVEGSGSASPGTDSVTGAADRSEADALRLPTSDDVRRRLADAASDEERASIRLELVEEASAAGEQGKGNSPPEGLERARVATLRSLQTAETDAEFVEQWERAARIARVIEARRGAAVDRRHGPGIRGGRGGPRPEPVDVDSRDLSSFTDPDPEVRRAAVLRAPNIEWRARDIAAELIAALTVALNDEAVLVRIAAVDALRRIHAAGDAPVELAVPALIRAADSPDSNVREAVQRFLVASDLAPPATAEIVVRYAIRGTKEERVRCVHAIAAKGIAGEEGLDALRRALGDPVALVRGEAAASLRTMGKAALPFVEDIRQMCHDPDPAVRLDAALTVAALAGVDDTTREIIGSVLAGQQSALRLRAVRGLIDVGDPVFADGLVRLVGGYEGPVAARALVVLGEPGMTAVQGALAKTTEQKHRADLVNALALFGAEAESALDAIARDEKDDGVRYAATTSLARIRRERERQQEGDR